MGITIKSEREIAIMRQAGKIVATVLGILIKEIKPGIKTEELDIIAEREIKLLGGKPSFKGYKGYPANLCVSVNDEIVHGIPGEKVLKDGDVVSLDLGVIYEGYQGDAARTAGVGSISSQAEALIKATEEALNAGINMARDKNRLGDVSAAIQSYAESRGYSVVREYTGHGIGRQMHEEPLIPNFGIQGTGIVMRKGMVLAIEPMLNTGSWKTRLSNNKWTVFTVDGGLSAHFENTVAVTETEAEILTKL